MAVIYKKMTFYSHFLVWYNQRGVENMHLLTKNIANDIVKETSQRLNRNVNIMNMNGIIIATQDKTRIGTVHKGAVEVLKTQKTVTIYVNDTSKWEGAQPGINLPIVFLDKIIGVIGITGDPNAMGSIGEMVKMTTELMIRQEYMESQMEWKQRTKETIIEQLLNDYASVKSIDQSLSLLGLQLKPPFTMVLIQISERDMPNRLLIQEIEDIVGVKNTIVSFMNVNRLFITLFNMEETIVEDKIHAIYHRLKALQVEARMAYGLPFINLERFSKSFKECELTLEISEDAIDLVSFAQIEAKSLIYQVDELVAERFSHRVLQNFTADKAKTLAAFFANNLNIQKTADALYVHRNTLIYRLNKIHEETSYDPKKFKEALILQVALWIYKKEQKLHF